MWHKDRLLLCGLCLASFLQAARAQEFARLLQQGPIPYLHGPALRLRQGPVTAGDYAELALGDWDGDGHSDLLLGSAYGDLLLYRGGPQLFASPQSLIAPEFSLGLSGPSRKPLTPELVDLNGDGVLDLLLGVGGELYFYARRDGLQAGQPLRTPRGATIGQTIRAGHLAPCACDLDGDGDYDLLVADSEGRIWWIECRTAATLRFAEPMLLGVAGQPLQAGPRARICAGDWDGDGRYDLLLGDLAGRLYFCRGRRDGFAPPKTLFPGPTPTGTGEELTALSPRLFDLDGDGHTELLLGCAAGFVAVYKGPPEAPAFTGYLEGREPPLDAGRYAAPTAADWNGDGVADILAGAEDGLIRLFLGRRDGYFDSPQLLRTASREAVQAASSPVLAGRFSWPRIVDLNGDGQADLALGGVSGQIEFFLQQGGLRPIGPARIGGVPIRAQGLSAIAFADYDGDGDADMFVGDRALPGVNTTPASPGPQYRLPSAGVTYYENEAPKGGGLPLFRKGVRLSVLIMKRAGMREEEALDAAIFGPRYVEPLALREERWGFLLGLRGGYYLAQASRPPQFYPTLILSAADGLPNMILPPLYSVTAARLSALPVRFQPNERAASGPRPLGLLCGLDDYGFVCYYAPEQLPALTINGLAL